MHRIFGGIRRIMIAYRSLFGRNQKALQDISLSASD